MCAKEQVIYHFFFSLNGPWYDAIFSWYHSQLLATSTLRPEQHPTQEYDVYQRHLYFQDVTISIFFLFDSCVLKSK